MANAYGGLRGALMQGVVDSPLGLPCAVENSPFEKPTDQSPWASAFVLPNQPSVATLGSEGQDAHDGILQIDLNYPLMTGEAAVTARSCGGSARCILGLRARTRQKHEETKQDLNTLDPNHLALRLEQALYATQEARRLMWDMAIEGKLKAGDCEAVVGWLRSASAAVEFLNHITHGNPPPQQD